MEKDDANNQRMRNFFVTFDEAAINGDQFRGVLLGKLDNDRDDRVHKPFLVRHDKGFRTPNGVTVFTRIMTILTKLGLDDEIQNFLSPTVHLIITSQHKC